MSYAPVQRHLGRVVLRCAFPSLKLTALKINGWKMKSPFGIAYFSGAKLVSGSVDIACFVKICFFRSCCT